MIPDKQGRHDLLQTETKANTDRPDRNRKAGQIDSRYRL